MTTDTVLQTVLFPDLFAKPLFAKFNQEQASSDGGAVLLKAAERVYGLVKAFARCLSDKRAPEKIRHTLADLIGQRIFGIACGHPDCNDAEHLADDPIHKLLLGRDPVAGESLASQATLSRFENAAGRGALYDMGCELAARVVERHRRRLGRVRRITIDLDPTDDPTHGAQQYSLFNGYYDNWWCVQQRLVCSAGDSPAGVIVRSPVAWIAAEPDLRQAVAEAALAGVEVQKGVPGAGTVRALVVTRGGGVRNPAVRRVDNQRRAPARVPGRAAVQPQVVVEAGRAVCPPVYAAAGRRRLGGAFRKPDVARTGAVFPARRLPLP